jgi:histidinol-phosphatase (PHP family)
VDRITRNYHTHTYRCKHATGDVADYCRAALATGITVLGISDHVPLPDGRWKSVRMDAAELPGYCQAIDAARDEFPGLTVLKSMECEHGAKYTAFYREELLGRLGFDYIFFGAHSFPCRGRWTPVYGGITDAATLGAFADYLVDAMASGLYAFAAHPDVFGCSYLRWDDEAVACSRAILSAAVAYRMPLEINGYGLIKPEIDTPEGRRRMYPWEPFWELAAEYDVQVVVNSDAHDPRDIIGKTGQALAIARKYGLAFADLSCLEAPHVS